MKKIFILFVFSSSYIFGQSITITPNSSETSEAIKLKKDGIGIDHRSMNSQVGVGTYADSYFGVIQTHTNHPLGFSTNNGIIQAILRVNGNFGLGAYNPQYPFVFKDELGDKISLYGGSTTNTSPHYGFGIQSAKLQIFTPTAVDDVVIGYGRSAAFTENVRFKGNGNVGIGTNSPNAPLQFASTIANRKIVMWETANNDHQYVGFGVNGNALRYQIDVPLGSHIFYAAANASSSTELMRVNSTGLGIGVSPAEKLHVAGNIRASSLAGTGVRNVKADANGNLTTTAVQTKYYSASNLSFVMENSDGTSNANYFDGMAYGTSGTDELKCPLVLPHGAVVSNIKIYYSDNSAGNDLTFSLERTHFPDAGGIYGSVSSSGSSASVLSIDISVNFTVDNQNNTYFVAVEPKTGGSVWINSITLCVRSVVVTYSE